MPHPLARRLQVCSAWSYSDCYLSRYWALRSAFGNICSIVRCGSTQALLALNVVDRNLATLLTDPLAHNQVAPPGFLVATRSMVVALGPFDWALRLVPFIAGVSVVLLAVLLATRELTSTVARVTFVGLVALSPVLIFYSSEFKPYSSDALAAIAVLVACSYRSSPYGT